MIMITGKDMIEWGLSGKAIKAALGVFVPQIQYPSVDTMNAIGYNKGVEEFSLQQN